jgi:hypothetical protein
MDELHERRAFECRLTPDRALETLDEAEEFLLDRGLLTRTADCALPSLFEACHEEPYAPDKPGFGQWPRTKFPWFGELGARGYPILAVHRGKSLLITPEVARLLDPICRAEIERMSEADPDWAQLLQHLADAGPSELEDLKIELGLKSKELKSLRYPLERCGAVVSRSIVYEDPHRHTSELARWDQLVTAAARQSRAAASSKGKRRFPLELPLPKVPIETALADLIVAGVRAAVVAPEQELSRWFSWKWYWEDGLVDGLVDAGRLVRPEPGWVARP